MKNIYTVIITLIFSSITCRAELLFAPPIASVIEPRIGSFYQADDERLRLDIGYSMDMASILKKNDYEMNFGADFFTFTRLRSEGKMKFPVETTDFFFGVNVSGKQTANNNFFDWRLRLAHISSHLSDGYSNSGKFHFEPYVYSREFFDLLISYNMAFEKKINLRPYAGITYIFSTIPDDIVSFIPQAGIETEYFLTDKVTLIAGADVKTGGY